MNEFIIDHIELILTVIFVVISWFVVLWTERIYVKSEKIAREMSSKVHARVDIVEDDTKALKLLRHEDKIHQDKFETQIMNMLKGIQEDIKKMMVDNK